MKTFVHIKILHLQIEQTNEISKVSHKTTAYDVMSEGYLHMLVCI